MKKTKRQQSFAAWMDEWEADENAAWVAYLKAHSDLDDARDAAVDGALAALIANKKARADLDAVRDADLSSVIVPFRTRKAVAMKDCPNAITNAFVEACSVVMATNNKARADLDFDLVADLTTALATLAGNKRSHAALDVAWKVRQVNANAALDARLGNKRANAGKKTKVIMNRQKSPRWLSASPGLRKK